MLDPTLQPREDAFGAQEPFEQYWDRVAALLQNVPRDVAATWIHRHWRQVPEILDALAVDLTDLRFTAATLPTAQVMALPVRSESEASVATWAEALCADPRRQAHELGAYMITNGTWPRSPVIYQQSGKQVFVDRDPVTYPLILVEGHMRLAYLRALGHRDRTREPHNVWIMSTEYAHVAGDGAYT